MTLRAKLSGIPGNLVLRLCAQIQLINPDNCTITIYQQHTFSVSLGIRVKLLASFNLQSASMYFGACGSEHGMLGQMKPVVNIPGTCSSCVGLSCCNRTDTKMRLQRSLCCHGTASTSFSGLRLRPRNEAILTAARQYRKTAGHMHSITMDTDPSPLVKLSFKKL